jgi:hypothetical protein
MILNDVIFKILEEQNLNTTKTKPIVDAIKNRKKISFYYKGPTRPKKDSVKPGYRIKAEAVALGLSKKGNLVVRAFVKPPSTSKKGFAKTGWRTFMVSRMGSLQVSDDVFNEKRPGYDEGDDNSMTVTYVKSDWGKEPEPTKPEVEPTPEPTEPIAKPEVEPTEPTPEVEPEPTELPQPKPDSKPEPISTEPTPEVEPMEPESTEPTELPQPKPKEKPAENPEDEENKNLQESINKIKRLMFS